MIRTVLLVAALLALSEGAVLVRFINTVPTRTTVDSVADTTAAAAVAQGGATTLTFNVDRVGLQYYSEQSGTIVSPTLVWTTLLDTAEFTGATAPYAWYFAMPPLRAYHTIKTGTPAEAIAIDKPTTTKAATDNNAMAVDMSDVYTQSRLFADGVGLYMSFAAGTYRMQAYAAINALVSTSTGSLTTAQAVIARAFTDSGVVFTFADNKVYTIIAYGLGQFGQSTPLTGNSVRLAMIEESVAPTTFGMASLRWFNAFGAQTSAMDVYSGSGVSAATLIASSIAVGSVSNYIDVAPGNQKEFPVAQTGSTATYLASSTAVQRDVRAGSRATVICATADTASAVGFCRAIPSRVLAYVRLVNDNAAQDSLVQGKLGAQKLSGTLLSLWASYEYPRPEQIVEQSQVMGSSIQSSHPATSEGLYPVVINVAPGTVTGYGEVFVPLYIMDYAVRFVITANAGAYTTVAGNNLITTTAAPTSYLFAPKFKRVNFLVKTDGFATITGRPDADDTSVAAANWNYVFPFVGTSQVGKASASPATPATDFTGVETNTETLGHGVLLDRYLEPGYYYSIISTASEALTSTVLSYQAGSIQSFYLRQDRTADTISGGITSGKGIFNVVTFGTQDFSTGGAALSLQQNSVNTVPVTPTLATVAAATQSVAAAPTATTIGASVQAAWVDNKLAETPLSAGDYTFAYSGGGTDCRKKMPASGTFSVADQTITDLFIMNSYGCRNNNGGANGNLVALPVQRGSAVTSGHSPMATSTSRSQRHVLA